MENSKFETNEQRQATSKSKSIIFVMSSSFLLIFGTYISGTILTPYAISLKATWVQVGVLSGSMYVVRLLFGTPIGKMADRRGTLAVLKYSLMLYPVIAIAYYLANSITILIGARLLHGIASAMMIPMGMAYIGHVSEQGHEGRLMSIYNLIVIIASSFGALVSTMVAQSYGYKTTFVLLFVLAAIALLIIQKARNDQRTPEVLAKKLDGKSTPMDKSFYLDNHVISLVFGNLLLAVTASLIGFFILPQLTNLGVPMRYAGAILALYYILSGLIQIPLSRNLDRFNKILVAVIAGIMVCGAMFLFPLSDNLTTVAVLMGLIATGNGIFQTSVSSLAVVVGRQRGMGRTMGFLNTANSAGMFIGCLILGILPVYGDNFSWLFVFTGLVNIILLLLFLMFWKKEKYRLITK